MVTSRLYNPRPFMRPLKHRGRAPTGPMVALAECRWHSYGGGLVACHAHMWHAGFFPQSSQQPSALDALATATSSYAMVVFTSKVPHVGSTVCGGSGGGGGGGVGGIGSPGHCIVPTFCAVYHRAVAPCVNDLDQTPASESRTASPNGGPSGLVRLG